MTRITGEYLNRKWKIGARQTRKDEAGKFYMPLERFPGALCDRQGYVRFDTVDQYENCPQLQHPNPGSNNPRLNVKRPGISSIPGYVKVE